MFPGSLGERETFELTAFDQDGNILVQKTYNDPADGRRYPVTSSADPADEYPQTGPDQQAWSDPLRLVHLL